MRPAEGLRGRVDVGLDVVDVRAGLLGEAAGLLEGGGREVEARHPGAEPGERERVGADVALEVDPAQPGDVAEERLVEADDVAQVRRVGDEPLEPVPGARRVGGGALVPVEPVHGEVVVHGAIVAHPATSAPPGFPRRFRVGSAAAGAAGQP